MRVSIKEEGSLPLPFPCGGKTNARSVDGSANDLHFLGRPSSPLWPDNSSPVLASTLALRLAIEPTLAQNRMVLSVVGQKLEHRLLLPGELATDPLPEQSTRSLDATWPLQ